MTKRQKFLATSLILSLGFFGITFLGNEDRLVGISALSVASLVIFAWSLSEGLNKNATLLSLILPPLFTLGVGLFWFLLPSTLYARLPIIILYGIGTYVILVTANVFVVSVIKKIPLTRAAKAVSFVLTLFTYFLLCDAVLSLKINILLSSLIVFLISNLLFLQGLWISKITREIGKDTLIYSVIFSYIVSTISLILFFWPVSVIFGSLILTISVYILLGIGQAKLEGRLFKRTVKEYLAFGVLVFIFMFIFTSWRN